jgi:transcriptional regulator with XRE-family HTH domain
MGVQINIERIRYLLNKKNLTQHQLAARIQLDPRSVEKLLKTGSTSADTLHKIAKALDVDYDHIAVVPDNILNTQAQTHESAAATVSEPFPNQLPGLISDFLGRNALLEKISAILSKASPVQRIEINGMGGVGKTTLAIALGHAVECYYPDGAIFLDLQGMAQEPMPVTIALRHVLMSCGIVPDPRWNTLEELLPRYRHALHGKRMLLIFDNVAGDQQASPLIAGDRTGIIFTTRRALTLDCLAAFSLDTLDPKDATTLIQQIIPERATPRQLEQIAKFCGYLPLALRVAADFLRVNTTWSVEDYLQELEQESSRLAMLKVGDTEQKDVEVVLKLSAARLAQDNFPLAMNWYLLARYPAGFTLENAVAVWSQPLENKVVLNQLNELVNRSMLLYDTSRKRYTFHDLMRLVAYGLFKKS